MLRELGHNVLEAASAEEAERLAQIPGIDTVLTDITLGPNKSGLDLARHLKSSGSAARIVMMTSLPVTDKIRSTAAKEFPLIGKPFGAAELTQALTAGSST